MKALQKHKLAFVSITYWFLLLYIIAALLWWFIALNNQNVVMTKMSLAEINISDVDFSEKASRIEELRKRKTAQYLCEGITFFFVIMIGAVIIFRATRKQIKFSESQQNFMMAVTHELKTPIAITQLNLETIQKRNLSDELREKMIDDSLKEVARLNNLCNNSLWAAQLDAGSYKSTKEEVNKRINVGGNNQNEMLLRRGKAISGIPSIIGTKILPNPPIKAGITIKNIIRSA